MTETVIEFQVDMTCQNCVKAISSLLDGKEGISSFDIDLSSKSVVVSTTKPTGHIQSLIESTGKRAVVLGSSGRKNGLSSSSAVAMLGGTIGYSVNDWVKGVIRFTQVDEDVCIIDGTLDGLSPGYHGLAIHETGDLSKDCEGLGGHFNPRNARHGSPQDEERHVGDLGNVLADENGRASFKFSDKMIKVWDLIDALLLWEAIRMTLARDQVHLLK
ncbi:Copper chaperone for superoxide dismutase [Caligus rogercresseyi]|uniref:Superoxide dismutase copper chaperone n=1 Tax=Caligus rogercresseyi TaxID=217165 RepID=A0A7T8KHP3_CALRO|nr:Copper chaperone for superoxide dismutase [Caligus rogercresseyi]